MDIAGFGVMNIVITLAVTIPSLLFAALALRHLFKMLGGIKASNELAGSGVPAPAQIESAQFTGTTLNQCPELLVQMQMHPVGHAQRQVSVRKVVQPHVAGAYQASAWLHVRHDPTDMNTVAIVGPLPEVSVYAPPGAAAPDFISTLQRMLQNQKMDADLRQSGQEMEADVVGSTELGLYCGGQNPFIQLEFEITDPSGGTFQASTEAVIGQAAVQKYGVGSRVMVAVDRGDRQRVSLVRSISPPTAGASRPAAPAPAAAPTPAEAAAPTPAAEQPSTAPVAPLTPPEKLQEDDWEVMVSEYGEYNSGEDKGGSNTMLYIVGGALLVGLIFAALCAGGLWWTKQAATEVVEEAEKATDLTEKRARKAAKRQKRAAKKAERRTKKASTKERRSKNKGKKGKRGKKSKRGR
jgi:hypothetical protein